MAKLKVNDASTLRGKLTELLAKQGVFSSFKELLEERMRLLIPEPYGKDYHFNGLKLTITIGAYFAVHYIKFNRKSQISLKNGIAVTITITEHMSIAEYYACIEEYIMDRLTEALENTLHAEYISLDEVIALSDLSKWSGFNFKDTVVWDTYTVSTYHIEQECGEGWITLPLTPEVETENVTLHKRMRVDKK